MNVYDFFKFSSRYLKRTFQAHPIRLIAGRKVTNDLFLGDYEGIEFPVVFKQAYGKKLEDMLDTGTVSLYLISNTFKTLLEQAELTGWKTFEVEVFNKDGGKVEGYSGLTVTGRCGNIDANKSEIVKRQPAPNGPFFEYRKGLYIGLDKWDGSDFFCPNGTLYIIITKRVASIIQEYKITNVLLENLTDVEVMIY